MESSADSLNSSSVVDGAMEGALASLLSGICASQDREFQVKLAELKANGQFKDALKALDQLDPGSFDHSFTWPMEALLRSLLSHRMAPHSEAGFLFEQHRYIVNHLTQIYVSFEGSVCSADKARWALRALARHFVEGLPIEVNLSQEYTFHLPERVLNTQDSLVKMFRALRRLHHGNPDLYLIEIRNLYAPGSQATLDPAVGGL